MIKKLLGILLFLPAIALAAEFIEGKDYMLITNPQPSTVKVPVITEFFSYGCPSCYKIDAPFTTWANQLGKSIQLERVPVVFRPEWELYAKAYYTAKMLAMTDKMSPVLFKTIQDDKNKLDSKQAMIALFVAQGIDPAIAKSAFENSPSVDLRVAEGMRLMAQYQITSVPAFVVNNKYKTDVQMAQSPERLLQLLEYLMKK